MDSQFSKDDLRILNRIADMYDYIKVKTFPDKLYFNHKRAKSDDKYDYIVIIYPHHKVSDITKNFIYAREVISNRLFFNRVVNIMKRNLK